jgi:uncharacterized protein (TIGR03435 family)
MRNSAARRSLYRLVVAGAGLITGVTCAQNAPSPVRTTVPMFDVVSIRENTSPGLVMGMSLRDWSLQVDNLFLKSLITSAYGVREGLIVGLPHWAEVARFDIRAKVTDIDPTLLGAMSREQRRAIMAALLQDRFQIKVHTVTKMLPVYHLLVTQDGPKFRESAYDGNGGAPQTQKVTKTEFTVPRTSMFIFSSFLEEVIGRTVIDKTGLTGMYDLHLTWASDLTANSSNDDLPSLFTALPEQLGLTLHSDKGPVETLVVDHIARPSEN